MKENIGILATKKLAKNQKQYLLNAGFKVIDEDFIHIEHVQNFVSDYIGNKYIVRKLDTENKTLLIDSDIEINKVQNENFQR